MATRHVSLAADAQGRLRPTKRRPFDRSALVTGALALCCVYWAPPARVGRPPSGRVVRAIVLPQVTRVGARGAVPYLATSATRVALHVSERHPVLWE